MNTILDEITLQQSTLTANKDGLTYRDLNKNGKLDIYEDPRQPVEVRVEDLLNQMTLEEKVGMLFIHGAIIVPDASLEELPGGDPASGHVAIHLIDRQKMNHFNLWQIPGVYAI